MIMKFKQMFTAILVAVLLIACSSNTERTDESNDDTSDSSLRVVTSFTLLEDIVNEVGGDAVTVFNLVPTGTDPHEYDPLPEDMAETEQADLIFYNGLNLEGGDTGWLA